eukprot:3332293-Alexandrium_andersonii.AAC.1
MSQRSIAVRRAGAASASTAPRGASSTTLRSPATWPGMRSGGAQRSQSPLLSCPPEGCKPLVPSTGSRQ